MKITSKILHALLIATLAASCLTVPGFSPATQLTERASGCHGRGGKAPSQTPAHDCCLTGHNVATLQASQSQRPDIQWVHASLEIRPSPTTATFHVTEPSPNSSSAPPGTAPLRI